MKCPRHESWLYEVAKGSGVFDTKVDDLPRCANRGSAFYNCRQPAISKKPAVPVSAFKAAWRKVRVVTADNFREQGLRTLQDALYYFVRLMGYHHGGRVPL